MKVVCIKTSFSSDNKTVLVKRGSVYNVTNVVKGVYHKAYQTDIWYELLETGKSQHLGALFVLAPSVEDQPTTVINKVLNKAQLN